MSDQVLPLLRVPLDRPLTRMELCVVALFAEGWGEPEVARMLGVSEKVVKFHIENVRLKIPGDLTRRARAVVWYRGAPLSVLMPSRSGAYNEHEVPQSMTRQGALHRAQAISQGRGCPCCGYDGVVRLPSPGPPQGLNGRFLSKEAWPNGKGAKHDGVASGDG